MAQSRKHPFVSRYPAPLNGAEIGGVVAGLLAGAGFTFLILLFAATGAGNSGVVDLLSTTFKPIVVTLYVATVVTAITFLVLRRGSAALLAAWLPVILLVLATQILNVVSWVN
jgi:hypothetical protein